MGNGGLMINGKMEQNMANTYSDGYLAHPVSGKGRPVLVLHAWWGLNDTIKAFCDRLAAEGFTVFAPDLYHGQVADTIPGAEALGQALDANYRQAQQDVFNAASFLQNQAGEEPGGLAVIGFSLGGYYALHLAVSEPDRVHSVVLFYGSGGDDFRPAKAAFLGHFAEIDPYETPAGVDELENALQSTGHRVKFYRYKGVGHWFFEPDRKDAYNAEAANLAWERTLAFLTTGRL